MKFSYATQYFIYFLVFSYPFNTIFTQESALDRFAASEIKGKVLLDWIITSGSTCQGISILRSTDSINFFQIGNIGGVCGNISTPQAYNFIDDNPIKNKINYYRLELGGIGLSKIIAVEIIDLQSGGFQIRPNPITDEARIYFSNNTRHNTELNVYRLNGSKVLNMQTTFEYFSIASGSLQTGIYIFTISTAGNLPFVNSKLIVLQ